MSDNLLTCGACSAALDTSALTADNPRCSTCGSKFEMHLFPAAFRNNRNGRPPARLNEEGQSTCYHHTDFKAETVCDHCGRYMCSLCDVAQFGGHICLHCVEQLSADSENQRFRRRYPRYDRLVLMLAVVPMFLLSFLTIITAPLALGFGFYGWNRSYNPVRTFKSGIVIGMCLAALQLGGWLLLIGFGIAGLFAGSGY